MIDTPRKSIRSNKLPIDPNSKYQYIHLEKSPRSQYNQYTELRFNTEATKTEDKLGSSFSKMSLPSNLKFTKSKLGNLSEIINSRLFM